EAFLAHLKYAEVLDADQRWDAAQTELWHAEQLNLGNPLAKQRLLHVRARRAEAAGALPAGTALRWLRASDRAVTDRAAYEQLLAEIDASRCKTCGDALALIGMDLWLRSDGELLSEARRAVDQHRIPRAQLYLARVRDRTTAEFAQLASQIAQLPANGH